MSFAGNLAKILLSPRKKKFDRVHYKHPEASQYAQLKTLLHSGARTLYGRRYRFDKIRDYGDFAGKVPLTEYKDLKPYILQMMNGRRDVLWPGRIRWFAKSSGTASARSKFIPVSDEILRYAHYRGGKDMLMTYLENVPDSRITEGKALKLGGTVAYDPVKNIYVGDLSGIMIKRLPFWARRQSVPDENISLIPDWEEKLERIIRAAHRYDVRSLIGIPSWFQNLLIGMLHRHPGKTVKDIWPGLEVFFHGGVHFDPYRAYFEKVLGPDMRYMEIYNASEGFFGMQDRTDDSSLLLMLDYHTFYEFIPLSDFKGTDSDRVIPLEDVRPGVNYALVISNASGLWRYVIGDTIRFTSVRPYKFVITGRTRHFINLTGEEVIVDNAEKAVKTAAAKTGATVKNYTAGPEFMHENGRARHEWIVEFDRPPADIRLFAEELDKSLRQLNSDYDSKRIKNIALDFPSVHVAPAGLFDRWLKKHHKLGGQHKVPRLSQNRKILDELREMMKEDQ